MKKTITTLSIAFCLSTTAQIISTVAGTGTASYNGDGAQAITKALNYPYAVTLDAAGNLYISDSWNQRIRMVDQSGIITTIAGNGSFGFSGDGGLATAAELNGPAGITFDASGNLYIADISNRRIRKVNTSGIISTVAGNGSNSFSGDGGPATNAGLNYPSGVTIDAQGNLYISDAYDHRIRKVDQSGIITTVAGNGSYGFSGDGGPATSAMLWGPENVAFDAGGNMYIADYNNHRIRKVDTSGTISTVAGTGTWGYTGDGGLASVAELSTPTGVIFDAVGNLFVTDYANSVIRKIDASNIISTVAGNGSGGFSGDGGQATSAQLFGGGSVAFDAMGRMYIPDQASNRIRLVELKLICYC